MLIVIYCCIIGILTFGFFAVTYNELGGVAAMNRRMFWVTLGVVMIIGAHLFGIDVLVYQHLNWPLAVLLGLGLAITISRIYWVDRFLTSCILGVTLAVVFGFATYQNYAHRYDLTYPMFKYKTCGWWRLIVGRLYTGRVIYKTAVQNRIRRKRTVINPANTDVFAERMRSSRDKRQR